VARAAWAGVTGRGSGRAPWYLAYASSRKAVYTKIPAKTLIDTKTDTGRAATCRMPPRLGEGRGMVDPTLAVGGHAGGKARRGCRRKDVARRCRGRAEQMGASPAVDTGLAAGAPPACFWHLKRSVYLTACMWVYVCIYIYTFVCVV
jgi:hypothetical protein